MTDETTKEIVKWARALERARVRRRMAMAKLREIDGQIREAQKFLRDLSADPVVGDGLGELLPGAQAVDYSGAQQEATHAR